MQASPIETEEHDPLIRVMALHALVYCPRLFYLEEVEEIRVADAAVWSGRRLHEELGEDAEIVSLVLESSTLGIKGKVDAVRRRSGQSYPIEHKRGRSLRDGQNQAHAWESDFVQAVAYAMLLEEHIGEPVREARVHYHRDNVTVLIPVGPAEHRMVYLAIKEARQLAQSTVRPPVTTQDGRCLRCSLAPVCLPEETRLAQAMQWRSQPCETLPEPSVLPQEETTPTAVRLFPPDIDGRALHVTTQGAKVGITKGRFRVAYGKEILQEVQLRAVSEIILHGHAQISTQCLRTCAAEQIPVHWVTMGGSHAGSFYGPVLAVQRKLRQYSALSDEGTRHALAQRIVVCKIEYQIQHLMRSSRGQQQLREAITDALTQMRSARASARRTSNPSELLGFEGLTARHYFEALANLVHEEVAETMRPAGRSKRPPQDRFNALLSFLYGQLYRDMLSTIIRVGLEPALGVFHTPRSASPPLVLDLMELFRVPVVDMAVLGAVNRKTFDPDEDFEVTPVKVWLSKSGRHKAIEIYERRKHEEYKHPVLDYALSYAWHMELEVRLLEKEWSEEAGLFATFRFR